MQTGADCIALSGDNYTLYWTSLTGNALYVVSNHLHVWVVGNMDFEDPAIPNFGVWKIPALGRSYTLE